MNGSYIAESIIVWIFTAAAAAFLCGYIYSIVRLIFVSHSTPQRAIVRFYFLLTFLCAFSCVMCILEAGIFRIFVDIPAYISACVAFVIAIIVTVLTHYLYVEKSLKDRLYNSTGDEYLMPYKRSQLLRRSIIINIRFKTNYY